MSVVSDNIKHRRIALGMSQEELAEKMGYTSRSSIAKIESGVNDIPQSKVAAFARALSCTTAELMGWIEKTTDDIDSVEKETVGERIRKGRKAKKLTQAELASRLGVSVQSIGQWERDICKPKPESAEKLAVELGIPWEELRESVKILMPWSKVSAFTEAIWGSQAKRSESITTGKILQKSRWDRDFSLDYVCECMKQMGNEITRKDLLAYESDKVVPDMATYTALISLYETDISRELEEEKEQEEALELAHLLRSRPNLRQLLAVAEDYTDQDIEQAIRILEALRKES